MIDLGRLEGFYRVAEEGGYAAGARADPRGITQPAIYQQVRRLEEELEVDLVERVAHRRVRLTPAGERLLTFLRPLFAELPEVLREMRERDGELRLRIDAAGLVVRELLPPWIRQLRSERADLRVELEELQEPDWERLRRGDTDLVIDYLPEVPSGLSSRKVATAHVFVAVPCDHPMAVAGRFEPAALRETPFVSYHPSLRQHRMQIAAVHEHIGPPPEILSASSVDSILSFVAAGLGYSIVPWLDPEGPRMDGVRCFLPKGHARRFAISAVWLTKSPVASTIRAALAAL